jgi:hypothetical protein
MAISDKPVRSETVTVRLDPKLRYLAELAARKQRRTVSSFVEWAIEEALGHVVIAEDRNGHVTVGNAATELWDVDDADRFAKLALNYPDLLTHDEQVRWKLVRECGHLWRGNYNGPNGEWAWHVHESNLVFERLRANWEKFKKVAAGELTKLHLPEWPRTKPTKPGEDIGVKAPDDDDIPF